MALGRNPSRHQETKGAKWSKCNQQHLLTSIFNHNIIPHLRQVMCEYIALFQLWPFVEMFRLFFRMGNARNGLAFNCTCISKFDTGHKALMPGVSLESITPPFFRLCRTGTCTKVVRLFSYQVRKFSEPYTRPDRHVVQQLSLCTS
eukprot:COSAG02_NODE_12355_length_1558_cov_17.662040_2_plen_146_part_00